MAVKFSDSTYKIKDYIHHLEKDVLILSNLFFRDYSCPSGCGGCCPRFSLDYIKGSERWEKFASLYPNKVHHFIEREVDGQVFMSDLQTDHTNHHCRNLDMSNGRCTIHESNPFSCEFELLKISTAGNYKTLFGIDNHSTIIKRLFGRGWALTKIDGTKGAMCEMLPFSHEKFLRDIELFEELREMIRGFEKENKKLDILINYLKQNSEVYQAGILPTPGVNSETLAITEEYGVTSLSELKKIYQKRNKIEGQEYVLWAVDDTEDYSDLETDGYRDTANEY